VSASTARAASLAELAAEAGPSVRTHLRSPSDAEISFFPARVGIGERVKIHASAHDAKEFVCIIRSPDNKATWSATLAPTHSGARDAVTFVFPDHFQGASTDHPGFYSVQVRVRTTYGSVSSARSSFEVGQ
jgi:hypothetical protein